MRKKTESADANDATPTFQAAGIVNKPKIWIEAAECLVPRKGTQQHRRELRTELRQSHPAMARELEAAPWYMDPDSPCGGDDWATFNWEWICEDGNVMSWRSYLPVRKLPYIKEETLGTVQQHSVNGVDDDGWIDYSFHLKSSYAFAVLKGAGVIPADSVLMNESEAPLSFDEGLEAA